jgi:hypothetical protein
MTIFPTHHPEEIQAMSSNNYYDVTTWPVGNPFEDVGEVLNSIIADIKQRQTATDMNDGGKPGAVIYLPPGDYRLRTQVLIDISFLKIQGSGHGFTSSSIRFNVPQEEWAGLHELWPGGSRILVDLAAGDSADESEGAAFLVKREGSPRISSVEFTDFCIDGLHFSPDGSTLPAENTYVNGKTGIHVASANDSFRINGMGFIYLEHALTIHKADALSIHDNFIAECGSCIELRGWGQASKITNNLIGAGFKGHSIYAENHGGLLITANNVFPRGASSVHLSGVTRSSVTNNRLHSFYPGMVILAEGSSENDDYGLLTVNGNDNSIFANHFSLIVDAENIRPSGTAPVIITLAEGAGNMVSTNHVVAKDVQATSSESCFEAQVDALLTSQITEGLQVTTVLVAPASTRNTILDSGSEAQVDADRTTNAVRATPSIQVTATPGM